MNKKVFELVGFICSCAGCALTMLFSIITCARGCAIMQSLEDLDVMELKMSLWFIGIILAIPVAIVGAVFSILSIDRQGGLQAISKMTKVSLIMACFAIMYGMVTITTICGYTGVLNDLVISQLVM